MAGTGQHKRITYLARQADLTPEQFSLHWSTVHADIARDFERLDAYFQNHVVASVTVVGEASPFEIDGIVELWFEDEEAAGAGFSSTLADRLKEDERRFLSGLSGSSVSSRGPTPAQPHKVWLVASTEPDANPWEVARDMVRAFVPSGAGSRAINLAHAPARLLSREGLQQLTPLPSIAISWGFHDSEKARAAFDGLRDAPALFAGLASARVLLAEEVRVVDNSHELFPTGPSDAATHWGALEDQLLAFIDRHRDLLIAALDGLDEAEARLRLVPSKTTLLGLVKHAAYAEQVWFGEALTGVPRTDMGLPAHVDASFDLSEQDTIPTVVADYRRVIENSRSAIAGMPLDAVLPGHAQGPHNLLWALLHLMRELAHHTGHADILREQILASRAQRREA